MEYAANFLHVVEKNGFTWLNVAFIVWFVWGVQSLYVGLKTGDFNPPWFLSGDRKARPIFYWLAIMLSLVVILIILFGALGFYNDRINKLWP
ncbi:MAG TPA: hypothetical protein VG839_08735 [Asticcacaulis sp.]|nr:hypothetical protein [Asticcacaulis sp.]